VRGKKLMSIIVFIRNLFIGSVLILLGLPSLAFAANLVETTNFKTNRIGVQTVAFSSDGNDLFSGGQLTSSELSHDLSSQGVNARSSNVGVAAGTNSKAFDVAATSGPPVKKSLNVAGSWTGPNGEQYKLTQRGSRVTIKEKGKTIATISISGQVLRWGTAKGTLKGNKISWDNGSEWTRKGGPPTLPSGPPVKQGKGVSGDWIGPNKEAYKLSQRGKSVTVREKGKTIATISLSGSTLTWGTTKGTLRSNSIKWTNGSEWTRKGGKTSGPPIKGTNPPVKQGKGVSGDWIGPNKEDYKLSQRGKSVTVREKGKTIATISISGSTLTWGTTKGTLRGNSIKWANGSDWTRKGGKTSGPPTKGTNPPVKQGKGVSGDWIGPNKEAYKLSQRGKSVTVREKGKTIATISISGSTLTWGTTKGTLRGNSIKWTNGSDWTRKGGKTSGPPTKGTNVGGRWQGPSGEFYDLTQRGNNLMIKQGSRTLANVKISAKTITWGIVKGTVSGNKIKWTNGSSWTRKTTSATTNAPSSGSNNSTSSTNVTRYENARCKSKWFLYIDCGYKGAKTVEIVKQHSMVVCAKDQSYGLNNKGLWVDKGCNATFKLGF
jgi:hypothetical protein